MTDYKEAAFMKIVRPQVAPLRKTFDKWITASSPDWQRVAVLQLTRYLALETGYRHDIEEHAASWIRKRTSVFATTDGIVGKDGKERECLIGIATFHTFQQNPVLYHCYLHPFYRGKGLMKRIWSEVQLRYPTFEVESPISPAMERFLSKVDHSHVLAST